MINDTITGAGAPGLPNKYYNKNEVLEIKIRQLLSNHIEEEKRTDGEVAFVIKDLDMVIISIMEFMEWNKK